MAKAERLLQEHVEDQKAINAGKDTGKSVQLYPSTMFHEHVGCYRNTLRTGKPSKQVRT